MRRRMCGGRQIQRANLALTPSAALATPSKPKPKPKPVSPYITYKISEVQIS
jgi:hypothetical protein